MSLRRELPGSLHFLVLAIIIIVCRAFRVKDKAESGVHLGPWARTYGRSTGSGEVAGHEIDPSDGADGRAGDRG